MTITPRTIANPRRVMVAVDGPADVAHTPVRPLHAGAGVHGWWVAACGATTRPVDTITGGPIPNTCAACAPDTRDDNDPHATTVDRHAGDDAGFPVYADPV